MKRRGSYLGGSTLLSARKNPHALENTAPVETKGPPSPRVHIEAYQPTGSYEEWVAMDFLCVDLLLSAEHAFLYNDLDTFKRLALNVDDISFQNYTLRDANLLMTGRRFNREKGEIILHRDGPLVWRWDILTNLYLAAHTVSEDYGDGPLQLDPHFLHKLDASRGTT